jgi:putative transcriptional regulator
MAIKVKFKSDAFEAIHSSASAMYKVGVIDKATMRSFDASCFATPL